ncbi:pyruvate formate lyase activating enzyme [Pseudobutyrivibrio sp. ACV-2]|uniref:glycyl-radical enzyme activating protein n=1 Tax=Pseudobutyrivibrio sp. ACV-2 TaxID=1520801 RepID=UPI00089C7748|nr:glycyl-radical enzyme activating protein [Pseudobutyrivibrio sp. ACV-2]SEA21190.1 pyruvate formate lyase activating enzyme [Pseudobutyrivibrio sp. ACV-2]
MNETKGLIFNIQRFSVHDGPGIRTVVFEKGCPLRCLWCANPESQIGKPQLAWTESKCIGCKSCINSDLKCNPHFNDEGLYWDEFNPDETDDIERICPSKALHVIGYETTVCDVITQINKDEIFYGDEEGGLTISGGEPLMQPKFTYQLLKEAKKHGISTAIETTGYGDTGDFIKIAGKLEYILMDIKTLDDSVHKRVTGVSNEVILNNFESIRKAYPNLPMHVRTPVIPRVNDTEDSIKSISEFLRCRKNVRYELLKYHRLGEPKYISLHRTYPMKEVELSDEVFELLKKYEFNNIS